MEGNYLTSGDLALYEQRRYGYDGYGYHGRNKGLGGIITGVALGGTALAAALVGLWGANNASKARNMGTMKSMDILASQVLQERQSRETWQNTHAPTISQYVDVQTGAGAFAGASANAAALAYQNSGINSAIGGCNFLRVARYSAPQPCPCDSCGE
jgi:hypothetical protein